MTIRNGIRVVVLAVMAAAAASCGDVVRSSRSPVMLVVNSLGSSSGATTMQSDVVITGKAPCTVDTPCFSDDNAQASLGVVMKDVTVTPTTNNQVTVSHYHVAYRRADGRNIQGLDVPYAFDGAVTVTIPANSTGPVSFNIVRGVAKLETPLIQLRNNADVITIIADVTFFGTDQVGNDVSVTGSILINFGNFSDS